MAEVAAGNMGNAILNLIYGQQNDPAQQMSDWANTQQARNRVAGGMDLQGNILPTPTPGAQPGVGSGQITGAPQDPTAAMAAAQQTGILPQSQEPNATKTPQSMGSMIIALQRQQEAAAGLQQSIGLGMSAFARPENRERVFKTFTPGAPMDPAKMGESLMALSSQTQGQDRMNALGQMVMDPVRGQALATKLNMSWDELKARFQADPGGVGTMIQNFTAPTEAMKNLEQITTYQQQFQKDHPESSKDDLNNLATIMRAGIAGDKAQAMVLAQNAFKTKFGVDPSWKNNPDGFAIYAAQQGQRQEALNIRPISEGKVQDLENKVDAIENDPALPGLMKRLVPGQGILSLVGYTDAERGLLQKIKQATSDEYVRGLADPGLGTRKTQQEMQYVGQSLGGVLNASNINYSDYKAGLERLKDQLAVTHADIYGQSGDFTGMDEKYHGYINDVYRPGGALSEGISGAPARKPLDDAAKQFWTDNQGKVPKAALLEHLRNLNYDTSGLK